jgi:hypothetical protein
VTETVQVLLWRVTSIPQTVRAFIDRAGRRWGEHQLGSWNAAATQRAATAALFNPGGTLNPGTAGLAPKPGMPPASAVPSFVYQD